MRHPAAIARPAVARRLLQVPLVHAPGSDLNGVSAVSDQIRHIARQAFLMQIQAANAIVMTRSNGVRVPGFEVVSEQMRELSRELGSCLAALRGATVLWLRVVSREVALARSLEILAVTARCSPAAARAAQPVLARVQAERLADRATELARRRFVVVLDDARRLAATGCVLARTAKLEAVYGNGIAGQLAEAAGSFTALADSVDEAVRAIARRMIGGAQRYV